MTCAELPELPAGYGQIAYEAACQWRRDNVQSANDPAWSELDPKGRGYFDALAQSVADYLERVPR